MWKLQGGVFLASRVMVRQAIVNWKNPQLEQLSGAFAGRRPSVSTRILCFCSIYNSCKTFQVYYSSNRQLVEIYLLLGNFTKFFKEPFTVMITFGFYCFACLLNPFNSCTSRSVLFFDCECCSATFVPRTLQYNAVKFYIRLTVELKNPMLEVLLIFHNSYGSYEKIVNIVFLLLLQQCTNLRLVGLSRRPAIMSRMKETLSI